MNVYDNLKALENNFDTYVFDAYGVFWNGAKFYSGAKEYMRHLVIQGKTVVVLSNSSQTAQECQRNYEKKNLIPMQDYNFFVSSGEVAYQQIKKQNIEFLNNKQPKKYFMIGQKGEALTASAYYQRVETPQEADFVFISVPYLTQNEVKTMPQFIKSYLPVRADSQGDIIFWDSLIIEPFLPIIKKCIELGLPALNANPDFYASEKHVGYDNVAFVVRNGLVAEYYRQYGGEVLEIGKPHANVYDYTFSLLQKNGVFIDKKRTAMIGDTIRTDIKGAVNAGIVPVLCTQTGVTANEIAQGKSLEQLLQQEDVNLNDVYLIRSVA